MPLGGYSGLQYGSFGWETYDDFLKKPNVWRNNSYYSGKPNSGNFHWYAQGQLPEDFIAKFYNWEEWKSLGQDDDSHFTGKHSSFFNPNNDEIHQLIIDTTGISYEELKAPFVDNFLLDDDMRLQENQMLLVKAYGYKLYKQLHLAFQFLMYKECF